MPSSGNISVRGTSVEVAYAEFIKWINGTYASLHFAYEQKESQYRLVAQTVGGLTYTCYIPIPSSDATNFENNYKNIDQKLPVAVDNVIVKVTDGFMPDGQLVPGKLFRQRLMYSGSYDMKVNASLGSPKAFIVDADPTNDIKINELKFVISTDKVELRGNQFFDKSTLTNGCLLEVRTNSVTTEMANFKATEDFFDLPGCFFAAAEMATDVLVVTMPMVNCVLKAGSGDFVKLSIRDNLQTNQYIKYSFFCTALGVKK